MARYVEKALSDVARWAENGWIEGEGLAAIRADLVSRRSRFGLPHIFGLLGAVLLMLSALTFVAANWEEIPRLVRVAMLAGALFVSYAIAVRLYLTDHEPFGQAALLVGNGIYGASIMLVAQMYHIDGNPPDAVLTWALGVALCAAAFRASAIWVLAFALFCLWSGWVTSDTNQVQWVFPFVVFAMAVLAWWIRFTGARHLIALATTVWVVMLPFLRNGDFFPYQSLTIGAIVAGIGAAIMLARPQGDTVIDRSAPLALMYGYAVAFCGLFNLQFIDNDPTTGQFALYAVLALALSLGVLAVGRERGRGMALWVAYLGFSVEVTGIYFKTVGTLIGTSFFFFTVGAVVIFLAWLGVKLRKAQYAEAVQ
ncbi:MAG: DUF2157 domain-containing protein [Tepidamorphaceae bacterium]